MRARRPTPLVTDTCRVLPQGMGAGGLFAGGGVEAGGGAGEVEGEPDEGGGVSVGEEGEMAAMAGGEDEGGVRTVRIAVEERVASAAPPHPTAAPPTSGVAGITPSVAGTRAVEDAPEDMLPPVEDGLVGAHLGDGGGGDSDAGGGGVAGEGSGGGGSGGGGEGEGAEQGDAASGGGGLRLLREGCAPRSVVPYGCWEHIPV